MISSEQLIRAKKVELARRYFIDFALFVFPGYCVVDHLQKLAAKLEAVAQGEIKRLMVFMPPRHGKSLMCSELFPAWYLGHNPDHAIILTSYEAGLACTFSRSVRNLTREPEYQEVFPGVEPSPDSQAIGQWALEGHARFAMVAAGAGGPITGKGANLFVVDDPVKNYEQAMSETYRRKIWDWWRATARTRLEPDAAVILIMTRWNEDDLAGRMLKAMGEDPKADQWEVLHLPAIDEDGNALWPERFPVEVLEQAKATLGSWLFEALYQGNPQPEGGSLIKRKWFKIVPSAPLEARRVRFWDLAATEKETQKDDPDRTAGVKIAMVEVEEGGRKKRHYYIEHAVRGAWSPGDVEANIHLTAQMDGYGVRIGIEQEPGAAGKLILAAFERLLAGYSVEGYPARGNKVARSAPWRAQLEAGNVFLVEGDWNWEFIDEQVGFPYGAHDDFTDATSGGCGMFDEPEYGPVRIGRYA